MVLALYKTKIQLEEKSKLNIKEQKQLKCIQEQIDKLDREIKSKYAKLGRRKIENQLKENFKEIMDIYSGNNLQLLAEKRGIEKEQFEEMIKQSSQERAKKETENVKSIEKREAMEKQKIIKYSKDDVFRKQVLVEKLFPHENDSVKKRLFNKLKTSITIGIEKKEEMDRIINNINDNNINKENYDYLIFGANWYIATGKNGELDMYVKEGAKQSEKLAMESVIQKMISKSANKIPMDKIEECTKMITGLEKASAVANIEKEMKIKNTNKEQEPDI